MNDREAIALVLRSAEANARGSSACLLIMAAIERVRALLAVVTKRSGK